MQYLAQEMVIIKDKWEEGNATQINSLQYYLQEQKLENHINTYRGTI